MQLVSMPLLIYIVILMEEKITFSRRDCFMIIFITISTSCGFALQFIRSYLVSVCLTVTAVLFMIGSLWLVVNYDIGINVKYIGQSMAINGEPDLSLQRYKLSITMVMFMVSISLLYMLAALGAIHPDYAMVMLIVCNVSLKVSFMSIILSSYMKSIHHLLVMERNLNIAKRHFLRYIMHEVRVPLSSVVMGINVLEKRNLDDDEINTIVMVKAATDFMRETLNNVLCMQKIEEGKFELSFVPFILVDVLKSVKLSLNGLLHDKNIRLLTSIQDMLPEQVIGDRYQVEHVLANLLSNAIKFSPLGGRIYLLITGDPIKFDQNATSSMNQSKLFLIKFSVRDEGPGILLEDQKKLFTAFYQVQPGISQKGEGSGIGLSICKQIVEFHGGTIQCKSDIGIGSTFSFSIPFKVFDSDDISQNVSLNEVSSINCRRFPSSTRLKSLVQVPAHVLVVDGRKCML